MHRVPPNRAWRFEAAPFWKGLWVFRDRATLALETQNSVWSGWRTLPPGLHASSNPDQRVVVPHDRSPVSQPNYMDLFGTIQLGTKKQLGRPQRARRGGWIVDRP